MCESYIKSFHSYMIVFTIRKRLFIDTKSSLIHDLIDYSVIIAGLRGHWGVEWTVVQVSSMYFSNGEEIASNLFLIISQYSLDNSTPTQSKSSSFAATKVVPLPANGS